MRRKDKGDQVADRFPDVSMIRSDRAVICLTAILALSGCAEPAAPPSGDLQSPANFPPTAVFTTNCTLLDCGFDASNSSDADGTIASFDWDFGDGTVASGVNPNHSYGGDGNFTIMLVVTDNEGATSNGSQSVSVSSTGGGNNPPSASFTSTCTDLSCTFDAGNSVDSDGTIVSYGWDFGDGSSAMGQTTNRTFAADGSYAVTLSITDNFGASSSTTQQVSVSAATQPSDGSTLYAQNCSTCHGADALGGTIARISIVGKTAAQITAAIATIPNMSSLTFLTVEEIQAIADHLATLVTGATRSGSSGWSKVTIIDRDGTAVSAESDLATGIYAIDSSNLSGSLLASAYFPSEGKTLYGFAASPGVLNVTLLTDQAVKTVISAGQLPTCFVSSAVAASCVSQVSVESIGLAELWVAADLREQFLRHGLNELEPWINVPFGIEAGGMSELLHSLWLEAVLNCDGATSGSRFVDNIQRDAGCSAGN